MTIRELYEKLGELVELEGDKPIAVQVTMEGYATQDVLCYMGIDGDEFIIDID